ncbi:hypothetical protein V6N12_040892 [Hibiscus sabdariffa]|uniref:Uncharacterized protein n=1 Tax=Hibiscus sabdariffa TaxID=183260 RepID=A0ABR2E507_9ROSI
MIQVTATVRNRSTEMVEAFYSVNQFGHSYLARWSSFCPVLISIKPICSLHFLEGGSDVGRCFLKYPDKLKSTSRYKSSCSGLASSLVSQESDSLAGEIVESSRLKVGSIPLLGRECGKMLSEIPRQTEKHKAKKSEADDNDNGHVASVTLIGALRRGSYPPFSQKPYNKVGCRKSTHDRMAWALGARNLSLEFIEDIQARWWVWKLLLPVKFHQKEKQIYRKKVKVNLMRVPVHLSVIIEMNTGAEDGTSSESKVGSYSATVDNVVSEPKLQLEPTNNSKKRQSKSFSASQDVAEAVCNT